MLPPDTYLALIVFSLVSSMTPGPNNMMLLASTVNFGWRRSLPHLFGITIGFGILVLAIGLGIATVLEQVPSLLIVLKIMGGTYLTYLAYRIATAVSDEAAAEEGRPMSFIAAIAFQWVNVKAWFMSIAAMAAFTDPQNFVPTVLIVTAMFSLVSLPCLAIWAGFGIGLRRFLQDAFWRRLFNYLMAGLLMLSLIPMLS